MEETEGEVAVYRGGLINALYTSTCGGTTENAEEIFEGNPVPYLRSVECVMERERVFSPGHGAAPPGLLRGRGERRGENRRGRGLGRARAGPGSRMAPGAGLRRGSGGMGAESRGDRRKKIRPRPPPRDP